MALPTFVNVGTSQSAATAITPGMPASVLANDILLLFIETADQAITVSGGTETWTEVTGSPVSVAGLTRLTVFWARASQDAPTSPTTSDSGDHQTGRIMAVRGCVTSGNPWDVTSTGTEAVSDTSGSITGLTTTVQDCLVVAAMAVDAPTANGTTNFSAWANTDLANVTERIDNTSNQGNGGGIGAATGDRAVPGTVGATTVTLANAAQKAFMTIALKPAEPVSTSGYTEIRTYANPSAGAAFSTTVTAGQVWKVWGGGYRLVCSATVANRQPQVQFKNGSIPIWAASTLFNITASQDRRVIFYEAGGYLDGGVYQSTWVPVPIRAVWLPAGTTVTMPVLNIQAGDQVSDVVLLVERAAA